MTWWLCYQPVGWGLLLYMVRNGGEVGRSSFSAGTWQFCNPQFEAEASNSHPKKPQATPSIVQYFSRTLALEHLTSVKSIIFYGGQDSEVLLYDDILGETQSHIYLPQMADQSKNTTKIPLGKPVGFVGFLLGNGCIRDFPIVVMKHHEQSNLNKKTFIWA